MEEEEFKDIPGFEGYQVSNFGRVKSLKKSKILKNRIGTTGYFYLSICANSKCRTRKVHQLVAMAFLNHTPCGYKLVVDHINNDKLDNRLENLQLITARENSSKNTKGSSKYIGVSWDKQSKKWKASIEIDGIKKNLGRFRCETIAHLAYQNKLKEISNEC